jgi:hypothetical protein
MLTGFGKERGRSLPRKEEELGELVVLAGVGT